MPRRASKAAPRKPAPKPAVNEKSSAASAAAPNEGDTYTVGLRSGGKVTMAVSVSLWSLSKDDRAFVLDLVDKLGEYPQPASASRHDVPSEAAGG